MNILKPSFFLIISICISFVVSSNVGSQTITNKSAIHVYKAWARATPPNAKNAAVYMLLQNAGSANELLIEAKTPAAKLVEIHMVKNEKGMMSMQRLKNISIPAKGSAVLKPGSMHMMLFDLKGPLKTGNHIDLSLHFKHAGIIQLRVPVKKRESDHPGQHNHNMMHKNH